MRRKAFLIIALCLAAPGCARPRGQGPPSLLDRATPFGPAQAGEQAGNRTGNVDLPRFPSISPDGRTIIFSWRGDLWKVSSSGGQAARLTSHVHNELRSAWSPDGRRVAFESDRFGARNIFLMNADGSDIRRVTDTDRDCSLSGFGVDDNGREVVTYHASLEGDLYRSPRPYMTHIDGGDLIRLHGAFGSEPVVQTDGRTIAFTRGTSRMTRRHYKGPAARDIWIFDRSDGTFRRLTDWAGNDTMARWGAGGELYFLSDRQSECVNIYRLKAGQGGRKAQRLTGFTRHDVQHFDVSADGSTAVLHVWDTLYTLPLGDPTAAPVALTIRATEDEGDQSELIAIDKKVREAALSPDGQVMAYVAYGEVYLRNIEDKSPTQRITRSQAREKDIAWSPDGLKLYFVSDSDGTDSIYAATVALTRGAVKEDFDKALNPPDEEPKENTDAEGEKEKRDATSAGEHSGSAVDGGTPTDDSKGENSKSTNGTKRKKKDLPKELQADRWHDAIRFRIEPVVQSDENDRGPRPSPDGKSLAFRRGRGDLMVLAIAGGESHVVAPGWDTGLEWRWSPDSRYIAYAQSDMNFNTDIWVVPADASQAAVNITRHPDNDGNPRWSADGRILAFTSERVNEEYDVWMVYLDETLESYTPKELEKYYKDAVEAAKKRKPLEVEDPEKKGDASEDKAADSEAVGGDDTDEKPVELKLEDAYLRLRRVTTFPGSEENLEITPGGDRYIFTATIGDRGLFSIKWDGKERKKLAGPASVQHVSLTGDKVVIVDNGRAGTVPPAGEKVEFVDISDKMLVDLEQQSSQKFREAARILGEMFYHPTMKGLDWPALTEEYYDLAKRTRTANEFNDVANRFVGELNGSHLGIYASDDDPDLAQPQGRLGTVHERVADGFEVQEVIPLSPAAKPPMSLQVRDVITAIDAVPFTANDTIESRLTGRVGKETLLTIRRILADGQPKSLDLLITPISYREEQQLKYRALRRHRADLVSEWSGGRIGYIHIQAMGQASLDVFERDLFAAAGGKDGLIIDVRDNGGGWTTDRLLASIMVQPHAYTIPRGADPSDTGHYPQDRLFIQRYTLPIDMMCNENSYSNAEIISHAFKTLKRGTLVGKETFGAVISTGGMRLIDGTWVRLPFRGWYLPDGTDMEDHGAVPDIIVEQTPEAESRNDDEQLRAAVADLLKRV